MKKGKDGIYNKYIKRIIDLTISIVALIVLSPLLLTLTVAGAIAMKGNPFFVQNRPGMIDSKTGREKIFKLIKFRTMSNTKDEDGNLLPDEKRINKYGKFLRATSLDELGELINIAKGDMAIVGPRPLLVEYLPYYYVEERKRHCVRPGLTGLAQINGRNSVTWERRFQYDVEYVENVSCNMDLRILWRTVMVVLKHSGVSENTSETEGNFAQIRKEQRAYMTK